MFNYIVHVVNPNQQRVDLFSSDGNRACRVFLPYVRKMDLSLDSTDDIPHMETYLCAEEVQANLAAEILSEMNPNVEIHIAKVTSVAISKPGKVNFQSVTEKGVVPK